jgi:hypothetical protein
MATMFPAASDAGNAHPALARERHIRRRHGQRSSRRQRWDSSRLRLRREISWKTVKRCPRTAGVISSFHRPSWQRAANALLRARLDRGTAIGRQVAG